MDKIRVSAKTKEEAITQALIKLGTTSDRLNFSVLVEGKTGLFGIGSKPWILEASVKEASEVVETEESPVVEDNAGEAIVVETQETVQAREIKAEKKTVKREKKQSDENKEKDTDKEMDNQTRLHDIKPVSEETVVLVKKEGEEFIASVLKGMGMDVELKSSFNHDTNELLIVMEGPDMGILIGKRGQTLDSLQYLTSLVINKERKEDYIRVKLDTEDYRSRREATLRNLAKNIAYKVKRTRRPVSLEPMNPYERRIIHSALQNDRVVSTKSEGDEPFRHIIVFCKNGSSRNSFGNRYDRKYDRTKEKKEDIKETIEVTEPILIEGTEN